MYQRLTFEQIAELPVLRTLYDFAFRVFYVNIALSSPDLSKLVRFGSESTMAPFCTALHTLPNGMRLCNECDLVHYRQARGERRVIRYRCHAGLTDFVAPVVLGEEIIAFLQCGQVHDAAPSERDWKRTCRRLADKSIDARKLRRDFFATPVLTPASQHDLITILELIGNYVVHAEHQQLLLREDRASQIVARARRYLADHANETLQLKDVADAAYTSDRNLSRVFRMKTGMTVFECLHALRIKKACELLETTDMGSSEVAFAVGFGSIQQFNRVFARLQHCTPRQWRTKQARVSGSADARRVQDLPPPRTKPRKRTPRSSAHPRSARRR